MINLVQKRDGRKVPFEKQKIINAISKAGFVKNEIKEKIATEIANLNKNLITIEEIQDLVEKKLMATSYKDVAKEYVRYRFKRELIRNSEGTNNSVLEILNLKNQNINEENSNKNPVVLSTQRDYMAGEVSKDLTMRLLLPDDIVKAHKEGIIHFHDADYFSQKMYNCFSGNTRLVTSEGVRKFSSFKDGEEVLVLDKEGSWRNAKVHLYGKQQMYKVYFKFKRGTKVVECTKNHRWILKDGSVTTELKVGDSLYPLTRSTNYTPCTKRDMEMFCLGFVIGDGCDDDTGYRVRLCGDKIKYVPYFEKCGYKVSNVKDSKDIWCFKRTNIKKQSFLDNKVWEYLSCEDKIALFNGYYAADGDCIRENICTSDARVLGMIEDISALAGYHVLSVKEITHDTPYKENAHLWKVKFLTHQVENGLWTVESIEPLRSGYYEQNAWCVDEPITHTFTLENGMVTGNCALINLDDMLQNGTVINGTLIEKPHSFSTACNIATQVMAQVASNQYGGQSETLSHLAPFVDVSRQKLRKEIREEFNTLFKNGVIENVPEDNVINELAERRLKDEIKRGVQTIQYQINTLMTSNGQTPFVTIFMYLGEVAEGRLRDDLALIIEEVVRQRYEGTKNEKGVFVTPAFPKLVYVLEEDNIHEDGKYFYLTKLCAKCSAKRLVPDYVSEKKMLEYKVDKNGEGHCYPPMGCRSFLTPFIDKEGKPKYYGRFNCGVVTINLVDVALSANKDFKKFWEIMDERLELCHRALQCRHQHLRGTISDVSPIHWQYGAIARLQKGETIDKLLYGGYCTISLGYAGLYECVLAMTGKSHTDKDAKPFALAVMQKLNDKCKEWKEEENIDYSVYGTPIESTTYKFAKALQERFGIIEGITDHDYITNSYHVNVREEIDAFTKLKFESEFQKLSPGGAISYVETSNLSNNIDAVIEVLKYIYDNIMYAELNTKSDYCQVCGYDGEIIIKKSENGRLYWECPNCGNKDTRKMNVARRTCGYIGSQFWNQGRTEEIKDRYVHLGNDL